MKTIKKNQLAAKNIKTSEQNGGRIQMRVLTGDSHELDNKKDLDTSILQLALETVRAPKR